MPRTVFSKLLLLCLILAFYALTMLGSLFFFLRSERVDLERVRQLDGASLALSEISMLGREYALTGNAGIRDEWVERVSQIEAALKATGISGDQLSGDFDEMTDIAGDIGRLADEVLSEKGELDESWLIFSVLPEIQLVESRIDAIYLDEFEQVVADRSLLYSSLAFLTIGVLVSLVLLCVDIYRTVIRPLRSIRKGLKSLGNGEFQAELEVLGEDELGEITRTFNEELRRLREVTASRDLLNQEVTERRAIQEELEETMGRLSVANEELQQFAYVASHDLQEPLRMVASFTQLLERKYGDALDEDAKRWIAYAVEGARRMKTLIEDLLQFSRLGTSELEESEISLSEVADQAVANLQETIRETGASVTYGDFPTIRGDRSRLISLFQNLIGNGIKYRREGVPPDVKISVEEGDEEWIFRVQDNGIGIEPRFAEKIFVIFQRLHSRDQFGGTGIGLALCRRIVEQHGGEIYLDSNPVDSGSVFIVSLPK